VPRGSVCKIGPWIQYKSQRLRVEGHHSRLVSLYDGEVRVRAGDLLSEGNPQLVRLNVDQPPLPGAQAHQHELVILTALQLKRAPVGPIGNNVIPDVC
jgi:hypothetical protein